LTVYGYANWVLFPLSLFVCLAFFVIPTPITAIVFLCFVGYFLWLYGVDAKAFESVAEITRNLWQGSVTQPVA
jgi:hypothetical protein